MKKKDILPFFLLIVVITIIFAISIFIINKYIKNISEHFYNEESILLNKPNESIMSINISESRNINHNEIPLNIFMCWHTKNLPDKMNKLVNKIKEENQEFNIYIYDDKDCRNMIEKYFVKDVINAFDSLIPGAYKADLWRLCVLYLYGGIYQDIKMEPLNNFKYKNIIDKEYFVRDREVGGSGILNALIVSKKQNIILEKGIKQIVKNVKNKYYGTSPLEPTGPLMLKKFFSQYDIDNLEMKLNDDFLLFNDNQILTAYKGYRDEQKQFGTKHYSKLWEEKKIYK